MEGDRVTVLDLMAEASASAPGPAPVGPPPGPMSETGPPRPQGREPEGLEERVERLSAELAELPDPYARGLAEELIGALLEFHEEGLSRALELVGEETAAALAGDGLVGSLLLIHGLYPVSLEERVAAALEEVRPYMESHGGGVQVRSLEDGVLRLRLEGSCDGCAASSATLELAIKKALMEAAPDLLDLQVEGAVEPPAAGRDIPGTPLPLANGGDPVGAPSAVAPVSGWLGVEGVADLPDGAQAAVSAGGVDLLVVNVNGTLLAYRDECAACASALHGGSLNGAMLACPSCSARFDLPRAGRGVDDGDLQLGPVPLLREGATQVRVALTA